MKRYSARNPWGLAPTAPLGPPRTPKGCPIHSQRELWQGRIKYVQEGTYHCCLCEFALDGLEIVRDEVNLCPSNRQIPQKQDNQPSNLL